MVDSDKNQMDVDEMLTFNAIFILEIADIYVI